ncbi:uracil-xanthine permease family protein [Symbiobacterium thermophilum]|uniref:Uracil permease n=1 Tax=Symbiobacterium thermophilum (strain DSM 24528 / JCM 14929 / IAM 14863 / T) TaxID=292459 RepID=Q67SY2_SYMTH|nr:solute carrier family 23 protein [Symbiobacterium thermophilum]BAD39211.1 uracil permease [Symbiobacterium thermophilum IAM 14863]
MAGSTGTLSPTKRFVLGLQHVAAMFGATVLVPIQTGLNPSVALLTAGLGTLLFHLVTKGRVPVFLGSSFAFIAAIQLVGQTEGLEYAAGGIVAAGLVYLVLSGLIYLFGVDRIRSFFPPIVAGPMIMVIGLTLAPVAVDMASSHWLVALITLLTVVLVSVYARGFLKLLPIICGLLVGFAASAAFGLVDWAAVAQASWVAVPPVTAPKFSLSAILAIAPLALVTMVEHIGDITTNGAVIGKDLIRDPGLHRTLMGDGLATALAGLLGGPANTTYSENTGVLAVTRVYDPGILRIAAVVAIALSFVGKLGALLQAIPTPVMGGISIVLFGMITSIGIRQVVDARVDLTNGRNLVIAAVVLVLGIGGAALPLPGGLQLGGMALAALVGVVLNKLLPEQVVRETEPALTGGDD